MDEHPSVQESDQYRAVLKNSPVPMHYQVERDMREKIEAGIWKAGQQLPSEMELCALYDVSRTTLRQAISVLVDEGLIIRERGRGSFIRNSVITAGSRGLTSFSDEMAALGLQATSRVISVHEEAASAELAKRLQIEKEAPVIVLKRVRYANEKPIGIQTAHLPGARFPGLQQADLENQSLYKYLEERYRVIVTEAEEIVSAISITGEDARLLHAPEGSPGFYVERLTFDSTQVPFELATSVMRGDFYRIQLFLRAPRRAL